MKKIYYKLIFSQTAPLRITNGDNDNTDSDLMMDSRGLPFIPGTSVAGVLRSLLSEEDGDFLFGNIKTDGSGSGKETVFGDGRVLSSEIREKTERKIPRESSVSVSDAVLPANCRSEFIHITHRDGIGLNERGTALDGAKFDFEVAEMEENGNGNKSRLVYTSILEWTGKDAKEGVSDQEQLLADIMNRISVEGIAFGARTSRGYGSMKVDIKKREFLFPVSLSDWLAFDPFSEEALWEDYIPHTRTEFGTVSANELFIEVGFAIRGSFAVRKYIEKAPGEEGTATSVPLTSVNEKPVIPGTSWAGAFRSHMRGLAGELGLPEKTKEEINLLFGVMKDKKQKQKSLLSFSETVVEGGAPYDITRNAVDRFTAAPVSQALYTARWWQGGTGKLVIQCRDPRKLSPFLRQILAASLIDLHLGLLTIGGSSGTGHGCVSITSMKVNQQDKTHALDQYETTFLEVS